MSVYLVKLIEKNRSYKPLTPQGVVIHDTETAGATALNEYAYFNRGADGRQASAHAFCDWTNGGTIIQTVPFEEIAWHCGETGNNKFIGVECCVPKTYNMAQFNVVWDRAVDLTSDLFVYDIKQTTVTKDNLMSHAEVSNKWKESTHQDPISYFKQYGKTVDDFRNAVQNAIYVKTGIKPTPPPSPSWTYEKIGETHVVVCNPMILSIGIYNDISKHIGIRNFVNGTYFWADYNADSITPYDERPIYPHGHIVNDGEILYNCPTHGKAVTTMCIFNDGVVQCKPVFDISKELGLKMAVSGFGIYPENKMVAEGFTKEFSDVGRTVIRPILGYRKKDNKIIIAVRPNMSVARAQLTCANLGIDFALSLDGGGSTNLFVDGVGKVVTDRTLNSVVMWG